jgi:hypothetical protein
MTVPLCIPLVSNDENERMQVKIFKKTKDLFNIKLFNSDQ